MCKTFIKTQIVYRNPDSLKALLKNIGIFIKNFKVSKYIDSKHYSKRGIIENLIQKKERQKRAKKTGHMKHEKYVQISPNISVITVYSTSLQHVKISIIR